MLSGDYFGGLNWAIRAVYFQVTTSERTAVTGAFRLFYVHKTPRFLRKQTNLRVERLADFRSGRPKYSSGITELNIICLNEDRGPRHPLAAKQEDPCTLHKDKGLV